MKTSMLSYSKMILEKVSFSKDLFEREYKKAMRNLSAVDALKLQKWIYGEGSMLVPVAARI